MKALPTNEWKKVDGTSFFDTVVRATVDEIIKVLGEPIYDSNDGEDKTNFEWNGITSNGEAFTVYDWKYYRPLRRNEIVDWHIGAHDKISSVNAKHELLKLIK